MSAAGPRLSLRTVLIGINLVVLVLPLGGIQVLRLYESALVRQTESALIAQGAFVAAFYRSIVLEQGTQNWEGMSRAVSTDALVGSERRWLPQPPELDLTSSPVLAPFPDGLGGALAEAYAARAGARMEPVLKDAQLVTLAGIRVVDPWGVIIASTGEDVGLSIGHSEEIQAALQGRAASRLRRRGDAVEISALDSISRASSVRVFVATPIMMYDRLVGAVMLSRTPTGIAQALYGKRWLLLQALLLLVGLVVLMSLLTSRVIARPIASLADQAGRIARGELSAAESRASPDAQLPRTTEVARLQDAIGNMARTLEERADYLRDFSRHVSHEFKTPIAGIRGAIEVLQEFGATMESEKRERFLANAAADADRLHRLTLRLSELTRAELSTPHTQRFSVSEAVNDAARAFAGQLDVDTQGLDPGLAASGTVDVLVAVLETLFENASQHGAARVALRAERTAAHVVLEVSDDGTGISASNRSQVFEPFFTTQRDHGGTGLGLTIASALMKQIGGSIALRNGDGATTFAVSLAAAD